jgi:hypothetical protein
METLFFIAGKIQGKIIGVIDSNRNFNYSDNFDIYQAMQFDTEEEAQDFINSLSNKEIPILFKYSIEEYDIFNS